MYLELHIWELSSPLYEEIPIIPLQGVVVLWTRILGGPWNEQKFHDRVMAFSR